MYDIGSQRGGGRWPPVPTDNEYPPGESKVPSSVEMSYYYSQYPGAVGGRGDGDSVYSSTYTYPAYGQEEMGGIIAPGSRVGSSLAENEYVPYPTLINVPGHHGRESGSSPIMKSHKRLKDTTWSGLLCFGLALYVCLFTYGLAHGNLGALSRVLNYQGYACGWDKPVAHLPYLYVPLGTTKETSRRLRLDRALCVARCPNEKDVMNSGTIAVPDSLTLTDVKEQLHSSSAISVVFSVNSPLYSTTLVGNSLCYPKDPSLQPDFATVMRSSATMGTRYLIGGVFRTIPVGLFMVFIAAVLGVVSSLLLRVSPGLLMMVTVLGSVGLFFMSAIKLISFALRYPSITSGDATLVTGLASLFSFHYSSTLYSGVVCLAMGCIWLGIIGLTWHHFSICVRFLEVIGDVLTEVPTIHWTPFLLSVLLCCWCLISFCGFSLLVSVTTPTVPERIVALNPNGGLGILPLYRGIVSSKTSSISAVAWLLISIWGAEVLLTICRFICVYVGFLWYYQPIDSNNERQKVPGLFQTVFQSLSASMGSLAAFSVVRSILRPMSMTLFGLSTRYQFTSGRFSCVDFTEKFGSVDVGPCAMVRDGLDHNTNSVLALIATKSMTFSAAMAHSIEYASDTFSDPATRLFGLGALATWTISTAISLTTFFVCLSVFLPLGPLSQVSNGAPNSSFFVAAPVLSSVAISVVAGLVSACFIMVWECVGDGVLFAYMMEQPLYKPKNQELAMKHPENYNRNLDLKRLCPASLKVLLSQIAEDRALLLYEEFVETNNNYR